MNFGKDNKRVIDLTRIWNLPFCKFQPYWDCLVLLSNESWSIAWCYEISVMVKSYGSFCIVHFYAFHSNLWLCTYFTTYILLLLGLKKFLFFFGRLWIGWSLQKLVLQVWLTVCSCLPAKRSLFTRANESSFCPSSKSVDYVFFGGI